MVDALFDINADGGDQGFDADPSQVLSLRLRTRPSGASSVRFQVWDASGFDPQSDPITNPPRKSKGAPDLTLVGATSGRSVSPAVSVDGTVSVTMPSTNGWGWLVRCVVDGGKLILRDGRVIPDPTKIHERMVVIRDDNGARPIIATETTQYEDDGWAGAFNGLNAGPQSLAGVLGIGHRSGAHAIIVDAGQSIGFGLEGDLPGFGDVKAASTLDVVAAADFLIESLTGALGIVTHTGEESGTGGDAFIVTDDIERLRIKGLGGEWQLAGDPGASGFFLGSQGVGAMPFWAKPSKAFPGEYFLDDFGAVMLPFGSDLDQAAVSLRTANTSAWNTAIATIVAAGGGILYVGPGYYLCNGPVGLDLTGDLNVNLIIQGFSEYSLIHSNDYTAPCVRFHTHGSNNLRNIAICDLVIRGGREGLSLVWVAYSHFVRVWCWGSKRFALQNEVGNANKFIACKFNESAQGIGNGTEADAVLFVSCTDTLIGCNYGEFCGGVIFNGGVSQIDGGDFFDCEYRGQKYFSYIDSVDVDITSFLAFTSSVIVWQGSALLRGILGNSFRKRFLTCFRAYDVQVSGRLQTDTGVTPFAGFINVETQGGTPLALNVGDLTAVFLGGNSGYFIRDADNVLHDATVRAQLEVYAGSVVTPLSSSAPTLLNPHFENNLLELRTFFRFTPQDCPQLTALLELNYATVTGSGYSSVPDKLIGNPAVQSVDARRPVPGTSNGLPTATFSSAASSSLSWPLNSGNNQTTKTGFGFWVKQPASGNERVISIGGGTLGASGQKLFLGFDTSQRVIVGLYASGSGGREGSTGAAAFTADSWIFVRFAYDSSLGTEALRCKLYINEVLQSLTFTDIGGGGVPTTLQTVTGNLLIGNFNNDPTPLQALNGSLGAVLYVLAGDVSAADGAELMRFRTPVAA